jgi:hypothetical protein
MLEVGIPLGSSSENLIVAQEYRQYPGMAEFKLATLYVDYQHLLDSHDLLARAITQQYYRYVRGRRQPARHARGRHSSRLVLGEPDSRAGVSSVKLATLYVDYQHLLDSHDLLARAITQQYYRYASTTLFAVDDSPLVMLEVGIPLGSSSENLIVAQEYRQQRDLAEIPAVKDETGEKVAQLFEGFLEQ